MVNQTLNLWGQGAVTLPKEWREQFPTKHFIAVQLPEGLLIKPILDIEFYETDESFGLKFPTGIEAGELLKKFKASNRMIGFGKQRRVRRKHG